MSKKQTQPSNRVYWTAVGTPHELSEKPYKSVTGCKDWVVGKMDELIEWASRYNHELEIEVREGRKELRELSLGTLPPNDVRGWSFRDDHTGVTFVYRIWVEIKEDA